MCGICGYVDEHLVGNTVLKNMNDSMYHRGPNDSGIWEKQYKHQGVGLAHRRLSILDLSELGHQPMLSTDEKIIIVFNGEIYNYLELKEELKNLGYFFKSNCDTEVIIAAYSEWGCNCFSRLNGMFAVAIWDERNKQLILSRDRIGKKPLYFYSKNKTFVFGSELKPIMKFTKFHKNINSDIIEHFLCNKYIAAPFTIFENTYKLLPGSYLIYKDGNINIEKYWDILQRYSENSQNKISFWEQSKQELKGELEDAVLRRMISDVPLGTFLSGGIDSTLITAIAQKIKGEPIQSFSIGFFDKERNEAPYAAQIAKHIGTVHKELYVGEKEIYDMLEDIAFYYDEPFSDSSQLPTMLVSKMASEDITVALSGDGGDELFCGYKMYDWTYIAQKADFIGNMLYKFPGMESIKKHFPSELSAFINNRNEGTKTQLYVDVLIEEADKLLGKSYPNIKFDCEKSIIVPNWQERRMLLDMLTYLPEDILQKTDRASMKYSLEVRCPLLDMKVIEKSFQIPHKYKYHQFSKKYILKEITYDYVPRELLNRPKKGFGVPLKKWLRTLLKPQIEKYADEVILKRQGIFVPNAVKELILVQEKSDGIIYSSLLWSFYIFQIWYQTHIEDLWGI